MAKVFLSYSRRDELFVTELHRRLTRDGVECFFDKKSIGWGDDWVQALDEGIRDCDRLVLVLTPDYCESEWSRIERNAALADDASGVRRKLLPLLLEPCLHLDTFPVLLKRLNYINVSESEAFEREYPRICKELGGTLQPDPPPLVEGTLPPVAPLPGRFRMPYRSLGDRFVGRAEDLWEVHRQLARGKTSIVQAVGVVMGTGGIGKSQLAIEFVHRFGRNYPGGVYWVDAETGGIGRLVEQVSGAAGVEINGKVSPEEQVEELWRGLNGPLACLLVLDNFPENEALQPYLPVTGTIHTLVTTRRRDLTDHPHVHLGFLDEEEALALLNTGARQFRQADAQPLLDRLGGLPLALELARGCLNERPSLTIADLVAKMDEAGEMAALEQFAEHYHRELPSGHERDVAHTFQVSWQLASENGRAVLGALAELAPVPAPRRLLRAAVKLEGDSGLGDPMDAAVDELARLSLVELDEERDPEAHRLALAFVRHVAAGPSGGAEERTGGADGPRAGQSARPPDGWLDAVRAAVAAEMGRCLDKRDRNAYRELEKVAPHAVHLLDRLELSDNKRSDIANSLGKHYRDHGLYTAARDHFRRALAAAEASYEPGHSSIATRQSNLALVLQDLGQLEEARDLLRQALQSDEASYESGHPSIATSQSNLALVLKDLGQLKEARDLLRQALAAAEATYEPGHPSIATRQSNLAMVLQDLGELEEARDLLRQALESDEASYEAGHPSIAVRQSNLATVLKDLGQLNEARDLLRRALKSDEASYEPGHPKIATRQSNLATVLQDLGQLEEARDLLRKASASLLERYGPENPWTRIAVGNLRALE